MITRRTLLTTGVTAGVAAASGFPLDALVRSLVPDASRPDVLLYDGRFAAGRLFGQTATDLGVKARDIEGDVTDVWYRDLRHRWKETDAAVAGLTTFSSYLSLRLMADSVRIRPQYLGYHHLEENVGHELFGREPLLQPSSLKSSGELWPSEVARFILSGLRDAVGAGTRSTIHLASERYLGSRSLISWILAPRPRL